MTVDWFGRFLSIAFLALAVIILFWAKDMRWRGLPIMVLAVLALVAPAHQRITDLVLTTRDITVRLGQLETRLADIAEGMETLVVAEPVETAEGGRILLRHEPIP